MLDKEKEYSTTLDKMTTLQREEYESFLNWKRSEASKYEILEHILESIIAYNDEYPEDEIDNVVEISKTIENFADFLEVFSYQIREQTLEWASTNMFSLMEKQLQEDPPEINWIDIREVADTTDGQKE